jgi:regulator of sirC expression with transglutaminase-like and TPR domain
MYQPMNQPISDLDYFRSLVADAARIPLFEAAASLAQDEYCGLDLQHVLSRIDELGRGLAERCRDVSTERKRLQVTSSYFYKELGFAGNVNDYYDPDNSFVHRVLETRRGIPISLAVIYMELAGLVGLNAQGISFPGHFLIKISLHEGPVVLDPFTGYSLSKDDISERLGPYRRHLGLTDDQEVPIGLYLQPAAPREILLRMLGNLREIYGQQQLGIKLSKVLERIQILEPVSRK